MTALLTDAEIREAAEEHSRKSWREGSRNYRSLAVDCREDFLAGELFARSIYEARLAEAISLMKEAAPVIETAASGLSERFDRFLATYAKEDKP